MHLLQYQVRDIALKFSYNSLSHYLPLLPQLFLLSIRLLSLLSTITIHPLILQGLLGLWEVQIPPSTHLPNVLLKTSHTEATNHEPQLEGSELLAQSNLPVLREEEKEDA